MTDTNSIEIGLLRRLFRADFKTGKLYWKRRPASMFDNSREYRLRSARTWNARFEGKEAFIAKDRKGYFYGRLFGRAFRTHRVIWALYYGEWPEQIDHINGNRVDNRISNLRNVSNAENGRNRMLSPLNTSGTPGVVWNEKRQHWIAQIKINYKQIYLGSFTIKDVAVAARKTAEIMYRFHKNHGRGGNGENPRRAYPQPLFHFLLGMK